MSRVFDANGLPRDAQGNVCRYESLYSFLRDAQGFWRIYLWLGISERTVGTFKNIGLVRVAWMISVLYNKL